MEADVVDREDFGMIQRPSRAASRSKRRRRSVSLANDPGRTLMATSRPSPVARPIDLAHTAGTERRADFVGPSRVPDARGIRFA